MVLSEGLHLFASVVVTIIVTILQLLPLFSAFPVLGVLESEVSLAGTYTFLLCPCAVIVSTLLILGCTLWLRNMLSADSSTFL